MSEAKNRVCPVCGGSGQIGFFQGESRFLLSMEECPECNGTGIMDDKKTNSLTTKTKDTNDEHRK